MATASSVSPKSLLDKLWGMHCVSELPDGRSLLFVDRHIIHDVSSPRAFSDLSTRRLGVLHPHLTFAVADHIVSTHNCFVQLGLLWMVKKC